MSFRLEQELAIFEFDDGKVNVLGHKLIEQFHGALDKAESQAKALVIFGREGVFSAGFDLEEIKKGGDEALALVNKGAELFHRMFEFPGRIAIRFPLGGRLYQSRPCPPSLGGEGW